jgi:Zn-dependent protease with chaperone function
MKVQHAAIAHLFISDPSGVNDASEEKEGDKVSWIQKLFMTHPPVKERIQALTGKTSI